MTLPTSLLLLVSICIIVTADRGFDQSCPAWQLTTGGLIDAHSQEIFQHCIKRLICFISTHDYPMDSGSHRNDSDQESEYAGRRECIFFFFLAL